MEESSILCLTDSSSSDSPLQSRRLQTSESDLDNQMKAIMILLEEDGLNPERRGGTSQHRRQQIIYTLEEYHRSCQSLAEKYDFLRSIFVNILYSGSSSSSDAEKFQFNINSSHKALEGTYADSKMTTMSPHFKSIAVDGSVKCNNENFNIEYLIKLRDELISSKLCNWNFEKIVEVIDNKMYGRTTGHADMPLKITELHPPVSGWENTWKELNSQVTMLMEETLQHQEELARRNNEKREAIKELQQQIERLRGENRALQISLRFSREESKPHRSQISRLAEKISNKIFGLSFLT